jgi:ribosome-binding factor A
VEYSRPERLGDLLREEISDIIQRRLRDPRVELATVTDVVVSGDLKFAKVFISKFGKEHELEDAVHALEHATGFIRGELGKRLTIRFIPELSFRVDKSIEYGARIEKVLKEIDEERKSRGGGGTPEDKGGPQE